MAKIARLRTRADRLREDQAAALRQALLPFAEGEMETHVTALVGLIDARTAADNGWTFVMLSPAQNISVVNYLAGYSTRPLVALRVWALCFEHLRHDSGEILLTRAEIASAVGERPENISRVMSELERFGAIIKRREKVMGMRGPGRTRYHMNPRVATHLPGKDRDKAQAFAPQLRLV
jgi:CRP-like cAMP-binding protein